MIEKKLQFHRKLVGEPFYRKDGEVITIWRYKKSIEVQFGAGLYSGYENEEVLLLGDGDFKRGIEIIGQTHYDAPIENLRFGLERKLGNEIKALKSI